MARHRNPATLFADVPEVVRSNSNSKTRTLHTRLTERVGATGLEPATFRPPEPFWKSLKSMFSFGILARYQVFSSLQLLHSLPFYCIRIEHRYWVVSDHLALPYNGVNLNRRNPSRQSEAGFSPEKTVKVTKSGTSILFRSIS